MLVRCPVEWRVGSSGALIKFEFHTTAHDHCYWAFVRRSTWHNVGSSGPEERKPSLKTCSLVHHPIINPTLKSLASNNPTLQTVFSPGKHALWVILLLKIRPGILTRRIIRVLCCVYPTTVYSDYPNPLRISCFCFLTWSWFEHRFFLLPSVFSEFLCLSWVDLEQVCKNSKANSSNDQATNFEPPFIVRSRTRNYKTYTKSSVLYLLVTLESRKVLNLVNMSLWLWMLKLRGLLSLATLTD